MRTWFLILIAAALAQTAGCAGVSRSTAASETLWSSRDQFVSIVPAEEVPGDNGANEAAELKPEQIRGALAPLQVTLPEEAPTPLFSETLQLLLSERLSDGLRRAGTGRDVVFAVTGLETALYGLAKRPVVTTGRVFVRGGKLNLILGMVHEDVRESDRRLQPFVPGSRLKPADGRWEVSSSTPLELRPARPDWLVLEIPAPGSPAVAAPVVPAAAPQPQLQKKGDDLPARAEERLRVIKELREKGLITDEEYRAKRKDILDAL